MGNRSHAWVRLYGTTTRGTTITVQNKHSLCEGWILLNRWSSVVTRISIKNESLGLTWVSAKLKTCDYEHRTMTAHRRATKSSKEVGIL